MQNQNFKNYVNGKWKMPPFVFHQGKWLNNQTKFFENISLYSNSQRQRRNHDALKCISYNIWFDQFAQEKRYLAILNILEKSDADFICLQEVIHPFLYYMGLQKWVQDNYVVTDALNQEVQFSGQTVNPYGVLIMAHKRVFVDYAVTPQDVDISMFYLPTKMARTAIALSYTSKNNERVTVTTVHLESLSNKPLRLQQMEVIKNIVAWSDISLWMGDFNFDSDWRENSALEELFPDFVDMWVELELPKRNRGKTFDNSVNKMLQHHDESRYDRVMFKSRGDFWKSNSIEILGTKSVGVDNGRQVFPSDHFGLVATIVKK